MVKTPATSRPFPPGDDPPPISSADVVGYIRDMLDSLQAMAYRQDEVVLGRLLEAAATEADQILKRPQ